MIQDCLKGLVGLTKEPCPCLPEVPAGIDVTASKSGYYLDALISQCFQLKYQDCKGSDMWQTMLDVLIEAIQDVQNELISLLSTRYRPSEIPFSGFIGQPSNAGPFFNPFPSTPMGITLKTRNIKGAQIVIEEIGLQLTGAANVVVMVMKGSELLESYTVPAKPQSTVTYPLPEKLYLDADGSEYRIQYLLPQTQPTGVLSLVNKISCGCGGAERPLNSLLAEPMSGSAYGLVIRAKTTCNYSSLICPLTEVDASMLVIAKAIQLRAAINMIDRAYRMDKITVYALTGISRERVLGNSSSWTKQYNDTIQNILTLSDTIATTGACYVCRPAYGFGVGRLVL